ncbi:MAG: hypothetical protein EU518_01570 [Promethearchaeota archaeon]|nr:MAG: hypothetical protein EU518_01570 [Candidatus Lokiarchaeota archaeon]
MNSLKSNLKEAYFKKKVCLLGGVEEIKNEFQNILSTSSLSMENKNNIGVNISKVDLLTQNQNFEFFLWNINCSQEKAFLRSTFYNGSEAVIVLISEDCIEQILQYLQELKTRIPIITVIFCVILNNKTEEEIKQEYFISEDFEKVISEEEFKIERFSNAKEIFGQISSLFLRKVKYDQYNDHFIIGFMSLEDLIGDQTIEYDCHDYYEPTESSVTSCRIDVEILKQYLDELRIDYEEIRPEWIKIYNKNFGTFSIFLRNGNVYFIPKNCEKCKDKKCYKKREMENYICIEARTKGWSNIEGLNQKELLVLSKILTLKYSDEKSLPLSILEQINKYRECYKH